MQISDREIRNSLRGLRGDIFQGGGGTTPDPNAARLLLAQVQTIPEVRRDKVESLKRAIREARYQVPSEEVAGKLLGRLIADSLR
ncbi:MAG: flagellar biosynthesis anti-sigma factor FlgM [Actinobacteria bacterium]|nr:flagellar biosynthesis anti-sigma factor FlgM [Actinomycetota bacterium]